MRTLTDPTDYPPRSLETATQVVQKVPNSEPSPPSELADRPPRLDEILLTALAVEKTDRYEAAYYLRDGLHRLR